MLTTRSIAFIFIFLIFALSREAHDETDRSDKRIDPAEVRAVHSIFFAWKIAQKFRRNFCSGNNPHIKCNCSYNSNTLCHITHLKVNAMDIHGPIPNELWNLTFLSNLNLANNYLTGPISPSVGNLIHMQHMIIGSNLLSGKIPKEIGQLTKLISLSLRQNNFSGPLPPELGNLSDLEQLYIDSCRVSGEIPPTFVQLKNLNTLWASDNELTGKIPEYIGSFQKLKSLRLQGNNFEGPIPSTFANLSSLTDLRISDKGNTNVFASIVGVVWMPLTILIVWIAFIIIRKKKKSHTNNTSIELLVRENGGSDPPKNFIYYELEVATNGFSSANKVGSGAYGAVYRGTLADGRVVAVKKLFTGDGQQMFIDETKILSEIAVGHCNNIVKYLGSCNERDKQLIVLEYLEKGSLQQALYGNNKLELPWSTRFNICLGIANGLVHLHEGSSMEYIIHLDIKPANILLDSCLNPKISDFGSAMSFKAEVLRAEMRNVVGTYGYVAPEQARNNRVSTSNDIYSFGVVIIQIVSGKQRCETTYVEGESEELIKWAWDLYGDKSENCKVRELVDPSLSEFDEEQVKRVIGVAKLCTQASPYGRPAMSKVVKMLRGDEEVILNASIRHPFLGDPESRRVVTSSLISDTPISDTDSTTYGAEPSTSMLAEEAPHVLRNMLGQMHL